MLSHYYFLEFLCLSLFFFLAVSVAFPEFLVIFCGFPGFYLAFRGFFCASTFHGALGVGKITR